MPPSVVLIRSFSDAWLVSPKYSHVPLPNAVTAGRLPEAQAVGPAGVEIVVALVGMADLVDLEVVEVPDPALFHVRPPGLRRDLRGVLAAHQVGELVEAVDDDVLEERASRRAAADSRRMGPAGRTARRRFRLPRRYGLLRHGLLGVQIARADECDEREEKNSVLIASRA